MSAVLELMAGGKLPVEELTTHTFPIESAERAYDLIMEGHEELCGVLLSYAEGTDAAEQRRTELHNRRKPRGKVGVGVIGVGNFARLVMLPGVRSLPEVELRGICSARGLSAAVTGGASGFAYACTDAEEVLEDEDTDAVFVLTRHNLHAQTVERALDLGKHVFVEKPLAITEEELARIDRRVSALGSEAPIVMVGFNRRFARATQALYEEFRGIRPLAIQMRMLTSELPSNSWVHDEEVGGGRLVGEACHAIDVCTAIADSPAVKVYAESLDASSPNSPTADRVFITMRHANGSVSSVAYQAGGARSGPKERIEVFGDGKTGICDDFGDVEVWDASGHRKLRGKKDKGHATETERFIRAVRRDGAPPIPWKHIHSVTWASLMAARSIREGVAFYSMEE